MVSIARLQGYLRRSAQRQYENVSVPCFTLFFHPTATLKFFNYAIPDGPRSGDWGTPLSLLRDEFAARGRHPRIEFIQEYTPGLVPALRAAGFVEEARQPLMACTAETYRPAPEVVGLTVTRLSTSATVSAVQEYLTTQAQGFDTRSTKVATEAEAEQFLRMIGGGEAFVARLAGEPAGVGMYTTPLDGVTEVVGLATLEPFRRRGIATALTGLAVQRALEARVEVVCLTAADERAGRVYERVGFARCATMLAFIDSLSSMERNQREESPL